MKNMNIANEKVFQQDIIDHLVSNGWMLGESENYDRKHALYTEDLVGYLSETQPEQWEKFAKMNPSNSEEALLNSVARQLDKKGTLYVLRNTIKDRGAKFRLCQYFNDCVAPLLKGKAKAMVAFSGEVDEHKAANFGKLLMDLLIKGMAA